MAPFFSPISILSPLLWQRTRLLAVVMLPVLLAGCGPDTNPNIERKAHVVDPARQPRYERVPAEKKRANRDTGSAEVPTGTKAGVVPQPHTVFIARDGDIDRGKAAYDANCLACHQADGTGKIGLAPSIRNRDFLALASDDFIATTIRQGRPGTAMIARADLNDQVVSDIIVWLRDLETPLPLTVTVDDALRLPGDATAGETTYATYCASCHGAKGEGYASGGSGPGIGLEGFLKTASDDYIFKTVKYGRIGTAMRPFLGAEGLANLSESDVHDIIAHLRATAGPGAAPPEPATPAAGVLASGDPAEGKVLYDANCLACHQPGGTGKIGLAPSIRNRDFLALASDEFIRNTIQRGRPGTAMPPRPDLNDKQVGHIIAWLRSLDTPLAARVTVDPHRVFEGGDAKSGASTYATYCASCHGPKGEGYIAGGSGPGIGLKSFLDAASDDFIFQTVKHGRIGTAMRGFIGADGLANLAESDVVDIIRYLRSL